MLEELLHQIVVLQVEIPLFVLLCLLKSLFYYLIFVQTANELNLYFAVLTEGLRYVPTLVKFHVGFGTPKLQQLRAAMILKCLKVLL